MKWIIMLLVFVTTLSFSGEAASGGSSGSLNPAEAMKKPEDKKPEDKKTDNPFGVDLKGKDEKVPDAAGIMPTKEELEIIAKFAKTRRRDETQVPTDVFNAVQRIEKAMSAGARNWTEKDAEVRLKFIAGMNAYKAGFGLDYFGHIYIALQDWCAFKDEDPTNFIQRLNSLVKGVGDSSVNYRRVVEDFMSQDKFTKATGLQNYQFVSNWLMPKLPARAQLILKAYVADLKAEAGIKTPGKP